MNGDFELDLPAVAAGGDTIEGVIVSAPGGTLQVCSPAACIALEGSASARCMSAPSPNASFTVVWDDAESHWIVTTYVGDWSG